MQDYKSIQTCNGNYYVFASEVVKLFLVCFRCKFIIVLLSVHYNGFFEIALILLLCFVLVDIYLSARFIIMFEQLIWSGFVEMRSFFDGFPWHMHKKEKKKPLQKKLLLLNLTSIKNHLYNNIKFETWNNRWVLWIHRQNIGAMRNSSGKYGKTRKNMSYSERNRWNYCD